MMDRPGAVGEDGHLRMPELFVVLAIIALGMFIRCWGITYEPYGIDELQSLNFVSAPTYDQFVAGMRVFGAPPLPCYFRVEYFLYHSVYPSYMTIRLLSLAAGILLLPLTYVLARRFAGRVVAVLATLCIALSPYCAWYSHEARMYALLPVYSVASVYSLLMVVEHGGGWRWWVVHVLANVLMTFTHFQADFVCVAEGLYLLLFYLRRFRLLLFWFGVHLLLAAWLVWWLKVADISHTLGFVRDGCAFIYPLALIPVACLFYLAGGFAAKQDPHLEVYVPAVADFVIFFVAYGLCLWLTVRAIRQRREYPEMFRKVIFLMIWLLLPVTCMTIASGVVISCLWSRYLIPSAPALAMLIGMAIMAFPARQWRYLAGAAVIGIYGLQIGLYMDTPRRPDYQRTEAFLKEHRHPGEIVLAYDMWDPFRRMLFPSIADEDALTVQPGTLQEVAKPVLERHARVWLIVLTWFSVPEFVDRFMAPRYPWWQKCNPYPHETADFVASVGPPPVCTIIPSWFPIKIYLFERNNANSAANSPVILR